MASTVVSLRVSPAQARRLQRKARQLGRSPSETGALLIDEALRRDEFAFLDFRDTSAGRQAFIHGTRVAVWQVVALVRKYGGNAARAARHLEWPLFKIAAALNYAQAFAAEIEDAISDNASRDFESLSRGLPAVEEFVVSHSNRSGRAPTAP